LDPLALSFQLKLLWLSGYLPHVTSCAECGAGQGLVGYSPRAGGAVCADCRDETTLTLAPDGLGGIEALLRRPLAEARKAGLRADGRRQPCGLPGVFVVFDVLGDELLERLQRLEERLGRHALLRLLAEQPRRGIDRGPPRDLFRVSVGSVRAALLVLERLDLVEIDVQIGRAHV